MIQLSLQKLQDGIACEPVFFGFYQKNIQKNNINIWYCKTAVPLLVRENFQRGLRRTGIEAFYQIFDVFFD